MERKKRTVFAVLIATVIVVAVFSSFAMNLFGQEDYQIRLPDLSDGAQNDQPGGDDASGGEVIRVDVTPETVQGVIATLARSESYHREIRIELWADEAVASVTAAEVWADGGWFRTTVTSPGGRVQHNLVGEGTRWLWYDGDDTALSFPADDAGSDLVQRIPTYEDVLKLSKKEIIATGYEKYLDTVCIFVEVEQKELGSSERYWISVSNGLLVAAERVKGEQLLYRMTALSTESPAPLDSSFALPDGQVLHTMSAG